MLYRLGLLIEYDTRLSFVLPSELKAQKRWYSRQSRNKNDNRTKTDWKHISPGIEKRPSIASSFIAGLAKGLAVLESFDTERQRLNATMAANRAGITAHFA